MQKSCQVSIKNKEIFILLYYKKIINLNFEKIKKNLAKLSFLARFL